MQLLRWLVPSLVLGAALLINACGGSSTSPPDPPDACDLDQVVLDEGLPGVLYTWAGRGNNGYDGGDNAPLDSRFSSVVDLTFQPDGRALILDYNNHVVRRQRADGCLETIVGIATLPGDGPFEFPDPEMKERELNGEFVPGDITRLNHPTDIIVLPDGDYLLSAWHNHKLRLIQADSLQARIVSGRGPGFSGDGADHDAALLRQPDVTRLLGNDLYILDQQNSCIRRIPEFLTNPDAIIERVAGQPNQRGYSGDGGTDALECVFYFDDPGDDSNLPRGGMTFDNEGLLYIADTRNHLLRRFDPTTGTIEHIAGAVGETGMVDGLEARLNRPRDVELGPDGRIYFTDEGNHAVRAYNPTTGTVSTIAGTGTTFTGIECSSPTSEQLGDGKDATEALLNRPTGIAFDPQGRLYIADYGHHRIRRMVLGSN